MIDATTKDWLKSGGWSIAPAGVPWCRDGNYVRLGNGVSLGDDVSLGNGVLWAAHLGYDPRGYAIAIGRRKDGELRIYAGCRDFGIAYARAHWGAAYMGVSTNGLHFLAAIDYGVALAAIHSPEA